MRILLMLMVLMSCTPTVAMAANPAYVLEVENQQGAIMRIKKKDAPGCARDLEAVARSYANLKTARCRPLQALIDEMTEKVRRYSCSIPNGKCWQDI